jgi:hypothetical protein
VTASIELIIYDLTMPVQTSLSSMNANELAVVTWHQTNDFTLNE